MFLCLGNAKTVCLCIAPYELHMSAVEYDIVFPVAMRQEIFLLSRIYCKIGLSEGMKVLKKLLAVFILTAFCLTLLPPPVFAT